MAPRARAAVACLLALGRAPSVAATWGRSGWKVAKDPASRPAAPGSGAARAALRAPVADLEEIPLDALRYDIEHVSNKNYTVPPWQRPDVSPDFKAYKSPSVTRHMTEILSKTVKGLNVTFLEVFNVFLRKGCLTYVLGGEVRDSILGVDSLDTDMAFTCTADRIGEICAEAGWQYKHRQGIPYIYIGSAASHDEGLEGKDAYTSLDAPNTDHEFACNTLFYDWQNEAVLDPTGHGAQDVVDGVVRIPGTPAQWDEWAAQGGWGKLLRLWKLRIPPKSFNVSEATFFYVLGELKALMGNGHADVISKGIGKFFKAYASRTALFAKQMRIDLGSTWFDMHVAPALPPGADLGNLSPAPLFTAVTCDRKGACTTAWMEAAPAGRQQRQLVV